MRNITRIRCRSLCIACAVVTILMGPVFKREIGDFEYMKVLGVFSIAAIICLETKITLYRVNREVDCVYDMRIPSAVIGGIILDAIGNMSLVALVICIFVEEGNTFLPAFATLIALYALRMRYSTLYIGETYIYWHNRYIAIESITEWAVTTTTNKKGEAMTHITLYRGDKKYLFKLLDEGYEPGIEKLIALFK